jgi:hypothetical protein
MSRRLCLRLGLGLMAAVAACGPVSSVDRADPAAEGGAGAGGTGGRGAGGTGAGGSGGAAGGAGGAQGAGGLSGSGGGAGAGGLSGSAGGVSGTGGTGGVSGGTGGVSGTGGAGGDGGSGGNSAGAGGTGGGTGIPDAAPDTGAPDAAPQMQVSHTAGAATTDLTQAGTLDWVHFGLGSAGAQNRKRGADPLVTMYPISNGSMGRYDDRPIAFSWSDGAPTQSATSVTDGVVVGDVTGRGFEIRALGSPERPRTLKVHVGVWGARAKMVIQLSDGGVPMYTDSSLDASAPGQDRVYTIVFRPAGDGQFLSVRWTVDRINKTYGNVTLQAATLAE